MRKLIFTTLIVTVCLTGAERPHQGAALLADAMDAAVDVPREYSIVDHYGDPDRFLRYIIRKPPVLA